MEQAVESAAAKDEREQPFDCAVISLTRTPKRLEEFLGYNGPLPLSFRVFSAVDGQTLERRRLLEEGMTTTGVDHWSLGSIGSALSHHALWQQTIASQRPICILEDDVVLRHDFSERTAELIRLLPPDWDLVLLGYNTDSILDVEVAPGCSFRGHFTLPRPGRADCENFAKSGTPVTPVRLNNAFGICAYLVSPRGARLLEKALVPLAQRAPFIPALGCAVASGTVDGNMNDLYAGLKAYACIPPIALPINDKKASTIYPESESSAAPKRYSPAQRLLRRFAKRLLRGAGIRFRATTV